MRLDKAKQLFIELLANVPADQWEVRLAELAGGDEELRLQVSRILAAHRDSGSFLESPSPALGAMVAQSAAETPGTMIGLYKLLEQIGEGGFGVVFMAEQQQPVRRKVALKLMKPGMDVGQFVARFEAERQALALMDHPNIAKVLDGGSTPAGRPYFIMDLVKGMPITEFCNQGQLPLEKRLELFVHVCQAVQHAHQKAIIHRDIKPSNVLVTLEHGTPLVKVIDFGIAKAMSQRLTDKTLFTGFAQLVGSPLYMSPEQAALSNIDIDTRSDIYSLGVLLYELLTGTTPFDKERLDAASYDELRRIIREEEPPKPSTRITTLGNAATTLSAPPRSDPRRLSQLYRGELDWIVLKALEKDRNRRYQTAGAVAADVWRYLNDEPVEACPPSGWYRFGKFARRNRARLLAAAGLLFSLVATIVVLTVSNVLIVRERGQKVAALAEAKANLEVADQQRRRARRAVDDYLTAVSENRLLDVPGLQPLRKQLLESALQYYQEFFREGGSDPKLRAEVAAAYLRVGQIHAVVDSTDAAQEAFENCFALVESLCRNPDRSPDWFRPLAGTYEGGRILHVSMRPPTDPHRTLRLMQRGADLWERLAADDPTVVGFRSDLAGMCASVGEFQAEIGWRSEAIASFQKSRRLWEALIRDHPGVPDYQAELASLCTRLALLFALTGELREALTASRAGVDLSLALVTRYPEVPHYRQALASSYHRLGVSLIRDNPGEAEEPLAQALRTFRQLASDFPTVPAFQEKVAVTHFDLATLLNETGRRPDAEAAFKDAIAILERLADNFPDQSDYRRRLASCSDSLGSMLETIGRIEDAGQAYRRALAIRRQLVAAYPYVGRYQAELAWQLAVCPLTDLRDAEGALARARAAVELSPERVTHWVILGVAHYRTGDWNAAVKALEKSAEFPSHPRSRDWFLAMAHWQLGDKETARKYYDQANARMAETAPKDDEQRRFRAEVAALLGIPQTPDVEAEKDKRPESK